MQYLLLKWSSPEELCTDSQKADLFLDTRGEERNKGQIYMTWSCTVEAKIQASMETSNAPMQFLDGNNI